MSMLSKKFGLLLVMVVIGLTATSWQLMADPIRRLPQTEFSFSPAEISIEQAISISLRENQQLRALQFEQFAAEHDRKAAATLRLPSLELETGYTLLSDEPSLKLGTRFGPLFSRVEFPQAQSESASARSRISLPIYTGGAITKSIQAANQQEAKVSWRYVKARSQLKIQVIESYLNLLLTQKAIRLATENAQNRQLHLNEIRNQHKNGSATKNSLLAKNAAVFKFRQQIRSAQLQFDSSLANLNRLLNRPMNESMQLLDIADPEIPSGDLQTLVEIAKHNRPELPELRAESESLRMAAQSIDAERLPQIGLFGEFAFQENRFVSPEGIGSLSVAATWNAFDGGRKFHRSESLHRQADSVDRLTMDFEHEIERQVFVAWNQLQDFQSQLRTEHARLNASLETVRVADRRLLQGVASRNDVLDAEFEYAQREFQILTLKLEITKSKYRLRHVLGIL